MKEFQKERDITYLIIAHYLSVVRFISDRIGVIYKGDIVEIADAEELFDYPLHPYTRSLISAIPIPDPQLEKNKVLFTYDPSVHDYSEDKPSLQDIGHGHYVYGNAKEIEEYKSIRNSGEKMKSITILTPEEMAKHDAERKESEPELTGSNFILDTPLHDTGSGWYTAGSLLLPPIGLIAGFIFKKFNHIRNFKACLKGALAGFGILGAIVALFGFFLLLAVL
jgi:oligopeptide transport system ATP-binding protein